MIDTDLLIDAVKNRPALYNRNHQHYNRKDIRVRLWDEIGHILFPNWANLDEREKRGRGLLMQRKWKSLRDCFKRELRLKKITSYNCKRKQYEFYEKLSFLLVPKNLELTQPMYEVEEVEVKPEGPQDVEALNELFYNQELQQELPLLQDQSLLQEHSSSLQFLRKKKANNEAAVRDAWGKQNKILEEVEDGDRLFLMSLVSDLGKLPLSTKYWVKMKFSEIMHQAIMSLEEQQKADTQGPPNENMNGDTEVKS